LIDDEFHLNISFRMTKQIPLAVWFRDWTAGTAGTAGAAGTARKQKMAKGVLATGTLRFCRSD
jgi:hypothetical protein